MEIAVAAAVPQLRRTADHRLTRNSPREIVAFVSDLSETTPHILSPLTGAAIGGVGDYVEILKPRVMSLVVFTGLVGIAVAPGHLNPVLALVAVLCIAVGAGAAGAINMWYDRDIDAMMARTAARPLPAGRMMPGEALAFGIVLAVGSVLMMALAVNSIAAGLLALTIAFYVFVYTIWLKRRTPQNIVIGGAAGAFPPLIGWAAVTGDIGWAAVSLFAIIFLLDPAAFLGALALSRRGLCQGRRADAAGGRRTASNQASDAALYAGAVAGERGPLGHGCRRCDVRSRRIGVEHPLYRVGDQGLDRRQRAQRAADVRFFAALPAAGLQSAAGRPHRRRHGSRRLAVTAMDDPEQERERMIRARNRALVAVLVALVALFYAITIVRIGG